MLEEVETGDISGFMGFIVLQVVWSLNWIFILRTVEFIIVYIVYFFQNKLFYE